MVSLIEVQLLNDSSAVRTNGKSSGSLPEESGFDSHHTQSNVGVVCIRRQDAHDDGLTSSTLVTYA